MNNLIKRTFFSAVVVLIALSSAFAADKATVTILETSDLHGAIAAWDYSSDTFADQGLVKVATIIKEQRASDPSLLLVDCGDNVQDNMIQEFRSEKIHPMAGAMNLLNYDAHVLGNHEFNFEYKNLEKLIKNFKSPVIDANIYTKNGKRWQKPYIIKTVNDVKVALIGLTAPHINRWEAATPEHFNKMTFTTPMEELGRVLKEIGDKADVCVVISHYGETGEYDTEGMYQVADVYGNQVPVFFIGHAHSSINTTRENGSILLEPGSKGANVCKATMNFEKANGKWVLTEKKGELIPVKKANIPEDPELNAYINKVHLKSREMANIVVGKIGAPFLPSLYWKNLPGIPTAILQDTAMMDLINKVQMEETGADVSLAALFNAKSDLPAGDFKKRDGVMIYKYDNTLMAVKVTGAQLKAIMEKQAGNFFNTFKPGDITISFDQNIRMYNYDMFAGVDYEIDISEPKGSRIKNVMYKGDPLKDDQELVLALNNYRYGLLSSSGLISSSTAPDVLVYNTGVAIRDKISDYVASKGTIMPECDNNWKIVGFDVKDEDEAEKIYQLIRDGKITIPSSLDGRTLNVKSVNIKEL